MLTTPGSTDGGSMFKFRLYVYGHAQNSAQAVANLTALCRQHLHARHEIEVVDVFREPKRALADGILITPTLIKLAPSPVRRIVGTLSQPEPVLKTLGLDVSKSSQLALWAKVLGVTDEALLTAIDQVGDEVHAVKAYLSSH